MTRASIEQQLEKDVESVLGAGNVLEVESCEGGSFFVWCSGDLVLDATPLHPDWTLEAESKVDRNPHQQEDFENWIDQCVPFSEWETMIEKLRAVYADAQQRLAQALPEFTVEVAESHNDGPPEPGMDGLYHRNHRDIPNGFVLRISHPA